MKTDDELTRQYCRKAAPAFAMATASIALAAAACGGASSTSSGTGGVGSNSARVKNDTVKPGGTLVFAADQEPSGFNVNTSKDNGSSVQNITENTYPSTFHNPPDFTVQMDKNLLISADLTSKSPETVVYKINPKATWSDGVPVDAKDFIYMWKSLNGTNKDLDVFGTTGYDNIKSVTGSNNDKTVTVVFKENFADWKSLFTNMVPAHYTQKQPGGWNTGLDKSMPISAGPFVITSYKPGDSLILSRNDKFWGPPAKLDKIVFRFLPESQTQPDALKNGEVQLIYPQPQLDLVQTVRALPNVESQTNFGLTFEHFDFNTTVKGLHDPVVRKAIATGLDRAQLLNATVKQFSDKAQLLGNRIYVNNQPEYKDDAPPGIGKGDIAAARKLLESDGYTKGPDGVYVKGGQKLSFTFATTSGNRLREQQGILFQAQMRQLGIAIRIANQPSKTLFPALSRGQFQISDFAWVATPFASANQPIYQTGGGSNYGKYSNPKVDALIKAAVSDLDPAKVKNDWNQVDTQIWQDMPTIPLYQKPTFIAYHKKYGNITDNASQEGPFESSGTWGLKQ